MTTLNDESTIVTMSDESSSRQLFFASPVRTPRKFKRNFQKFGKPFPLKVSRDAGDPISADDADDDESDVEYGAPQSFFSSPYDELRSFSAGSPFTMKQSSNDSEKIGYQFPDFRGKESYDEIERTSSVFHEESPLKQRIPTITTLNQNREDQILASIALDQISIKDDPNDDKNKFVQDPNGEYVVFPTRQLGTLTIPTTKPMPHPNTKSKLPPRPLNTQTLTSNSPSLMSPASDVSDNEHEYFSDTNRSDVSDMTEGSRFSGVRYNTYERSTSQVRFSGGGIPMNAMATPPPMFYPNQFFPGSPPFLDPNSTLSNHTSPDAQSIGQMPSFFGPHSPGLTAPSMFSITMYRDSEDALVLKNYLQDTVGCTEAFALQYSNILIKNGVPTIEVLRRRLLRNREFLLDIGFDEYTALDIVDILFPHETNSPNIPPRNNIYHQADDITVSSNSPQERRGRDNVRSRFSGNLGESSSTTARSRSSSANGRRSFGSQMFSPPFLPRNSTAVDPRGGRSGYIGSGRSMMSGVSTHISDDDCLSEIASVYAKALNNTQDRENYQKLLTYVDEEDNPYAEGFLMRLLALGHGGLDKNISKATKYAIKLLPWMKDVIQETEMIPHNTSSMYCKYFLGTCYAEGLSIPKDPKLAFKWYKLSAEQGYDAAQAYIGYCYYSGKGVVKDAEECVKWYRKSAAQGFASAQCNLGMCYETGEGVAKDMNEALRWYELSAKQGNCTAQYNLALCYELGKGTPINLPLSLKYYQLAAEQDHAVAQYTIGMMYLNGYSSIVSANSELGFYWLQRSSNKGYSKAHTSLGTCYEKGIGVEQNYELAIYYYQLGVDHGDFNGNYYLGFIYFNSLGVPKDYKKAVTYYRIAAEKGHAAAQNNLGYCYFQGLGVEKHAFQAVQWYEKAAEQGYTPAQYNLGYCYEKGYGVVRRQKEMLKWYRLAANNGHEKAMNALQKFTV